MVGALTDDYRNGHVSLIINVTTVERELNRFVSLWFDSFIGFATKHGHQF
jgi:hypothetical protein